MPRKPESRTATLDYAVRTGHIINSGEVAKHLDISGGHASSLLAQLAAKDSIKGFELAGGHVYIAPQPRRETTHSVLSRLAYFGLRADQWLKRPRSMPADGLVKLRNQLVDLVTVLNGVIDESNESDNE